MFAQQNKKVLTRQQLHDLVWSKPMIQVAKQFKLSDNGLRKICRKYEIPMPKGGYWQKIQYGKSAKKLALPAYKGEDAIALTPSREKPEPSATFTEVIIVPKHIAKFHPLVVQTRKQFSARRIGNDSAVVDCLDIRVTQDQLSRACRIMDTLIKALEGRGAEVSIDRKDQWKRPTYALIDGEKVHFGLREASRIEKIERDPERPWGSTQEFVPNGTLEFNISDYLWGLRTKWRDREKGTLEVNLTPFINGLWIAAAELKKRRLAREAESRQEEEARKEHERRLQAIEDEKRRIQILEQQATSWKKSREILAFVRSTIKKQGPYAPDSEFAKWVSWAKAYADQLDPLT